MFTWTDGTTTISDETHKLYTSASREPIESLVDGRGNTIWGSPLMVPYSQYWTIPKCISRNSDKPINQYGAMFVFDKPSIVDKAAIYLQDVSSTSWRRTPAIKGTMQSVTYVPFVAMNSVIVASGLTTSTINTFRLSKNSAGVFTYQNYSSIKANLLRSDGVHLSLLQQNIVSSGVRVFYNLAEMRAYMNS